MCEPAHHHPVGLWHSWASSPSPWDRARHPANGCKDARSTYSANADEHLAPTGKPRLEGPSRAAAQAPITTRNRDMRTISMRLAGSAWD